MVIVPSNPVFENAVGAPLVIVVVIVWAVLGAVSAPPTIVIVGGSPAMMVIDGICSVTVIVFGGTLLGRGGLFDEPLGDSEPHGRGFGHDHIPCWRLSMFAGFDSSRRASMELGPKFPSLASASKRLGLENIALLRVSTSFSMGNGRALDLSATNKNRAIVSLRTIMKRVGR
jgi:hypothetical protein